MEILEEYLKTFGLYLTYWIGYEKVIKVIANGDTVFIKKHDENWSVYDEDYIFTLSKSNDITPLLERLGIRDTFSEGETDNPQVKMILQTKEWFDNKTGQLRQIVEMDKESKIMVSGTDGEQMELPEHLRKGFILGISLALDVIGKFPITIKKDSDG